MKRTQVITEGAILLALFLLFLMIALYVPVIGTILLFILPLPFIIFTQRHGISLSIVLLITGCILSIIFGNVTNILIAAMFGSTGIVMGLMYRRRQTIGAIIGGSLAYTLGLIIIYIGTIYLLNIDLIKDSFQLMRDSIQQSKSLINSLNPDVDVNQQIKQVESGLKLMEVIIPSVIVITGVIFAFISHSFAIPILQRLRLDVPPIKLFREMKLPTSLVWYYLFVTVLSMFKTDSGGFYYIAVSNIFIILQFFIILQGCSFIFYYVYRKGLPKAIAYIAVIGSILIPILLYIVRILGIIDLCFPLRDKMEKK
ncbi:YybS family protein [Metabacillus malikii]|uniref:Uncharacterized protein YybS (DUF2232 family) n=1 Tax=Metabacillus malikii TaxID=1504265 RepID=A0ABT9ZLM0_9BACI|nr:YybS family protein [Metabacillus malikii]MDQ0233168.1 uncharacterized protein YybS (DUF2232 family) [Metabacillus malikii]